MSRTERRPQQRYTRSSTTTSVTQLLSDSCSSLLARLTTRSREIPLPRKTDEKLRIVEDINLGSTRTRLEDKYSDVLEKYVRKKREQETTPTPADNKHGISKSATTSSLLLSEKAYPFVTGRTGAARDKTPFRAGDGVIRPSRVVDSVRRPSKTTDIVGLPSRAVESIAGLSKATDGLSRSSRAADSVIRPTRHKSHKIKDDDQPRASIHRRRRSRADVSENPSLKLCPVDIEPEMPAMSTRRIKEQEPLVADPLRTRKELSSFGVTYKRLKDDYPMVDDRRVKEKSPPREICSPVDPAIKEREARRKEIQSLINKYVMLDEAYGKVGKSATRDREKTVKAIATQTASAVVPLRVPVSTQNSCTFVGIQNLVMGP